MIRKFNFSHYKSNIDKGYYINYLMENKTQKALIIKEFGKPPVYDDLPLPVLK